MRMRTHSRRRGYTAVEVMLSIIVLGVGAAGVMSMQKASIQGNADAHMLDVGTSIARTWVERLRRDGMTWTLGAGQQNWSSNTFLISQIGSTANAGKWIWPVVPTSGSNSGQADPGYSRAFDILGRDMPLSGGTTARVFCANIRGDWITQDEVIRAEVRVYWLRQLFAAPTGSFCSGTGETPDAIGAGGGAQTYHFVYAATAIQRTPPSHQ
jgi:prepilin-type N-terminal cleavage/methylation domain-containing protein